MSEQHIEFRSKKLTLLSLLSGEPVTAIVQAKDGRTNRWRRILKFTLHIEVMADPDRYITYGNHPESWPDDQLERARAAFAELRDKINERQGAVTLQPSRSMLPPGRSEPMAHTQQWLL